MIGFSAYLIDAGISPFDVKLVRHQDARGKRGRTPYDFWCARDGRLELYQSIQTKERFAGARYVATFVVPPFGETLFVGVYEINGRGIAPAGLADPLTGEDVGGKHLYEMAKTELLNEYEGRLVIDWGLATRSWVQRAAKRDKCVLEIRPRITEPPFPGFMEFRASLSELAAIPGTWRSALEAVSGVYLLVCLRTGKPYVGSVQGVSGFWGRWHEYASTGHGGNERMRLEPHSEYQVTILEVAASSATAEDLLEMESRWKEKLRSREFGLNRN